MYFILHLLILLYFLYFASVPTVQKWVIKIFVPVRSEILIYYLCGFYPRVCRVSTYDVWHRKRVAFCTSKHVCTTFFLTTPRLRKEKSQEKTWYGNLHRSDTGIGNATCISIHTLDTPHLKAPTPFAQDGDFFTPMHAHSFHYHDL